MKALVIALCLLGVAYAEVSLQAVFQAKWSAFKAAHGKTYTPHEEQKRLNAFLSNTLHIEKHNERFSKGLESFEMGHNELSDLTLEEFQNTKTGFNAALSSEVSNATVFQASAVGNIPTSADFSQFTPVVHNQGQCGSCFSFSACGALEGILGRKRGQTHSCSEQELVDCSGAYGNGGCSGGQMVTSYQYIQAMGGIATREDYPYAGQVQACKSHYFARNPRTAPVNIVRVANNVQAVKAALVQNGPLAIATHSGCRPWQMYRGGIVTAQACGAGRADHAVVLVGFGDENGQEYFKIKNSWGVTWGENGFLRLAVDACQVTSDVCYPYF